MDQIIKNGKIDILLCTYNRAYLIARAIESILKQTHQNWELIILDDCSTDTTESIVLPYTTDTRIQYLKNNANLGISKSRNRGLSLATGDYIAMLDSDDSWIDPHKLEKQLAVFEANPKIGLVGSAIVCVDEKGAEIRKDFFETSDAEIRKKILSKNQFAQSSIVIRKEVLDKVGTYDESLEVCEDLDLWLRIGTQYKLANIEEVTTAYTIHSGSISKQRKNHIAQNTDFIIEKYKNDYPGYLWAKSKSLFRRAKAYF